MVPSQMWPPTPPDLPSAATPLEKLLFITIDATRNWCGEVALAVQVRPASEEYHSVALFVTPEDAIRLLPSCDMAIPYHSIAAPGEAVFSDQVIPESVEDQMLPFSTAAESFVPSLDMAMPCHSLIGTLVTSVQFDPELMLVQIREAPVACEADNPDQIVAARIVASLEQASPHQGLRIPPVDEAISDQVPPESVDFQNLP